LEPIAKKEIEKVFRELPVFKRALASRSLPILSQFQGTTICSAI
jgi:hypothetical protein